MPHTDDLMAAAEKLGRRYDRLYRTIIAGTVGLALLGAAAHAAPAPSHWDADSGVLALARGHGSLDLPQVEQMLHVPADSYYACLPQGSVCWKFSYPDGSYIWVQFKDQAYGFVDEWTPDSGRFFP